MPVLIRTTKAHFQTLEDDFLKCVMFKSFDKIYHTTQRTLVAGSLWFWRPENWSPTLKMLCACIVLWTSPSAFRSIALNWKSKGMNYNLQLVSSVEWPHWKTLMYWEQHIICHEFDLGSNSCWNSHFVLKLRKLG